MNHVCNNINEVYEATNQLSIAKLVPLQIDDGGVIKSVENFKGIYNVTQGKFCTTVTPHYNLIGHKQYFDAFAEALTRLGMKYTMKISESGNRAFADIMFEGRNLKFEKLNEEFATGVRLTNSYDKSTGLYLVPRFTRLACTNGMIITRSEKTLSIKHTSKIAQEIESFIEKKLNAMIEKDVQLQTWVSQSMEDSLEWQSCCRILHKLFDQPKHLEPILKELGISLIHIKKNKNNEKESFSYVFEGMDKNVKIDRWKIYNAVTAYLTRGEHITPHIENHFHKKAEQLLTTPLNKLPMIEVPII